MSSLTRWYRLKQSAQASVREPVRAVQVARSSVPVVVADEHGDPVEVEVSVPDAISQGVQAGTKAEFAKELAEELGLRTDDLSDDVLAAAGVAAGAQIAADAAVVEAEAATAAAGVASSAAAQAAQDAIDLSAAAQSAAEAHADAQAAAAQADAIAEASGDATAKAAAAQAAAEVTAAADALVKANAAQAAAEAVANAAQGTASAAASAASVADGKATAAAIAAAAAHSAAGDAKDIADQAQLTADRKNTTHRDTTPPSGTASVGDRWEQYDKSETPWKLVGTWSYEVAGWESTVMDSTYLPLVDIGEGTFGQLGGARLAVDALDFMTAHGMELSAARIIGSLIATAESGQRMEFDLSGLKSFNATEEETASLEPVEGGFELKRGWIRAGHPDTTGPWGVLIEPGRVRSTFGRTVEQAGIVYEGVGELELTQGYMAAKFEGSHPQAGTHSESMQIGIGEYGLEVAGDGKPLRFTIPVEHLGDMDWVNVSVPSASGTFEYSISLGTVYVRFDFTLNSTVTVDAQRSVGVMVPSALAPSVTTPLPTVGYPTRPAIGAITTTGGLFIRNTDSGSQPRFQGYGSWKL